MEHLKMAVFSPEFKFVEHKQDGEKHTFVFSTETIDVERVAADVEVDGRHLNPLFGPNGHRYKPAEETDELVDILAVPTPRPYQPYTVAVTLTEKSPHFKDFLDYAKKHGE